MATLAFAAPASAASHVIDLGFHGISAGPVLAGERVAWASASAGEIELHLARFDGSDERIVRMPSPATREHYSSSGDVVLAASDRRWALGLVKWHCNGESGCKYQQHYVDYAAILSAPLGDVPQPIAGCTSGGEACRPCTEEIGSLDVSADAVAFNVPCRGGATVRDFAPGAATPERSFEQGGGISVAGRSAAVMGSQLEVYDWVDGVRRFGVDTGRFAVDFDVQEDGTVAYTPTLENFESELAWASASEPFRHSVGVSSYDGDLFLAGIASGQIAFQRAHVRDLTFHIGVVALDGGRSALARPSAAFRSVDFDGSRLTYMQQPCTVTAIVVWDATGTPPGLPRDQCPPMSLARRTARIDLDSRRLPVRLGCPATPRLGCYGNVRVHGRLPGRRREKLLAYDFVRLGPDEERSVELSVSRRLACKLVRNGDTAHAKIDLESWTRDERDSASVRRSLVIRGLAACDVAR